MIILATFRWIWATVHRLQMQNGNQGLQNCWQGLERDPSLDYWTQWTTLPKRFFNCVFPLWELWKVSLCKQRWFTLNIIIIVVFLSNPAKQFFVVIYLVTENSNPRQWITLSLGFELIIHQYIIQFSSEIKPKMSSKTSFTSRVTTSEWLLRIQIHIG